MGTRTKSGLRELSLWDFRLDSRSNRWGAAIAAREEIVAAGGALFPRGVGGFFSQLQLQLSLPDEEK